MNTWAEDPERLWWNSDFSPKLIKMFSSNSMEQHLTKTREDNFEIHNIVLSSQSISLM